MHFPSLTSLNKKIGIVKVKEKKIALPVIAQNRGHLMEVYKIINFNLFKFEKALRLKLNLFLDSDRVISVLNEIARSMAIAEIQYTLEVAFQSQ